MGSSTTKPTWESDCGTVKLWLGDCLEVMRTWPDGAVDAVVTDPPYPEYESYGWPIFDLRTLPLSIRELRGFYFWSHADFTLPYTARHIWSKANRNVGKNAEQYETIFECNGLTGGLVMRHAVIDSEMNATLNGDQFFAHPCQKPIRLVSRLVKKTSGRVCDFSMGSGTTGVAAVRLGRQFWGVEIDPGYFEIAKRRIQDELNRFPLFETEEVRTQGTLYDD